ncbi:hypothetical protein GOBAR_AA09770 [Gossypium barbadense]|uniref:Uncharacterized protein n=1 Tax=Gossypium barbadense TaxID=3634 RepID=A0A2P5Y5L6_GOSBA|nr:hypothetical protein GOBAR_AA09770 [Gossypium barbadense]
MLRRAFPVDISGARTSSTIGTLVPRMCGSFEHHQQLGASDVWEPRAVLAPWYLGCARASSSIGTLVLGYLGASDTISNLVLGCMRASSKISILVPRMCGSLEQHQHLVALDVQEPRATSVSWCLDVQEPRTQSATLVPRYAEASSSIGTLVPRMYGSLEQHWHLSALDAIGRARASGTIGTLVPQMCGIKKSDPGVIGILCCIPKRDGIIDVLPSILHLVPFGVRGGPESCPVSRVCPLKSVWPCRSTGAQFYFRMRKRFLRVSADVTEECYLVDLPSSHMLVSKIKPCMFKKLVVRLRGGSASLPHDEDRSARPYCRLCAPGFNWLGRSSGAITLKKLESSKQAYACIH